MGFFSNFFGFQKPKATTINLPANGQASWSDRDFNNFAKEAYLKCVVSYRCINEIARAVSSVPWNVYTEVGEGKREVVEGHPISKVLHRANPQHGFSSFQNKVNAYLALDGNSYIERLSPEGGINAGVPQELWSHRPDTIKQVFDNNTKQLIGYEKNVGGVTIKFWEIDPITMQSDLLHLKLFHPINDIMGLSPVEPTSREIDTYNEATEWNKKLLENEARPGMLFKFKGTLGDQQYERFKKDLAENHSGGSSAGKNLILDGDADAVPYGWNMHEMDFTEGGREKARQIAQGFGVPSQIIGIKGESTFANFEQAELSFWEKTILFYLSYQKAEYNNWFFGLSDKTFIDYDLDQVPALALRRQMMWEKAEKSSFITINEKREMVGLMEHPEGNVILVPATMIPLGTDLSEEENGIQDDEKNIIKELEEEGFDDTDLILGFKKVV